MSTPTPWAHLPNAAHIDQLLQHARDPQCDWSTAWGVVWDVARAAAWGVARDAARDAARVAAWEAARDASWDAARYAARGAACALVAWDDAARWLDPATPSDALRAYIAVAPGTPLAHAALLLLPYKLVLETTP